MFVGKDIFLKQYEKRTFFRFFILLFGSYIFIFIALASLYYYTDYIRLNKESKLQAQLNYIECKNLNLENCKKKNIPKANMKNTYTNILFALGLLLFMLIPISIFLSFFSLHPVRKASVMIDNFIAEIVHDINTPISTILLNTKSLLKNTPEKANKLNRTLSSAEQLYDMQHDLLALIDEKSNIKVDKVELSEIVKLVINDFKLKHTSQTFIINCRPLVLYVNQIDIRRILQNIISNAIKYNINNNPIELNMKSYILIIKDKGKGMKNPKKIFEKNYREDYSIQGNGIGLASVLSMLKRNNIDIKVFSTVHTGTMIHLNFEKTLIQGSTI